MSNFPPIFIVGAPRSGTTLLRRLLNQHSMLCVPEETHFFTRLSKPFVQLWERDHNKKAIQLLNEQPIVQDWQVNVAAREIGDLDGEAAYAYALKLIMSKKAISEQKIYWAEKTPAYVFFIQSLRRLFPDARFIHLYRDGRDVAISLAPLSWGPNNAYSCARYWRSAIEAWRDSRKMLGDDAFELSYESLCQEPDEYLEEILKFIGLPYESVILENTAIKKNNWGKWRNKFFMSADELSAFEVAAGETLNLLHYETKYDHPIFPQWKRAFAIIDNGYKVVSNRILRRGNHNARL